MAHLSPDDLLPVSSQPQGLFLDPDAGINPGFNPMFQGGLDAGSEFPVPTITFSEAELAEMFNFAVPGDGDYDFSMFDDAPAADSTFADAEPSPDSSIPPAGWPMLPSVPKSPASLAPTSPPPPVRKRKNSLDGLDRSNMIDERRPRKVRIRSS